MISSIIIQARNSPDPEDIQKAENVVQTAPWIGILKHWSTWTVSLLTGFSFHEISRMVQEAKEISACMGFAFKIPKGNNDTTPNLGTDSNVLGIWRVAVTMSANSNCWVIKIFSMAVSLTLSRMKQVKSQELIQWHNSRPMGRLHHCRLKPVITT